MMSLTVNDEVYPILIALMVVAVVIYLWGVYFHLKIIQASRKDKDLTWKVDIANSIIILFHFFQSIFMHLRLRDGLPHYIFQIAQSK